MQFFHTQIPVPEVRQNLQRGYPVQISRYADHVPGSQLDQGIPAAEDIHQSDTGIDEDPLGHDPEGPARSDGRGHLGTRERTEGKRIQTAHIGSR